MCMHTVEISVSHLGLVLFPLNLVASKISSNFLQLVLAIWVDLIIHSRLHARILTSYQLVCWQVSVQCLPSGSTIEVCIVFGRKQWKDCCSLCHLQMRTIHSIYSLYTTEHVLQHQILFIQSCLPACVALEVINRICMLGPRKIESYTQSKVLDAINSLQTPEDILDWAQLQSSIMRTVCTELKEDAFNHFFHSCFNAAIHWRRKSVWIGYTDMSSTTVFILIVLNRWCFELLVNLDIRLLVQVEFCWMIGENCMLSELP